MATPSHARAHLRLTTRDGVRLRGTKALRHPAPPLPAHVIQYASMLADVTATAAVVVERLRKATLADDLLVLRALARDATIEAGAAQTMARALAELLNDPRRLW